MYLTARAAVAALLPAAPLALWPFSPWPAVAITTLALGVLVLVDWRSAPRPDELLLRMQCPNAIGVQGRGVVEVHLHNPSSRPLEARIHIEALPSAGVQPTRQTLHLAPGSWGRAEAHFTPRARGNRTVGPLTVRTAGRLRLAGRQQTVQLSRRLKVYPALPGRRQIELRLSRARLLQSGVRSSAVKGGGTEFDSLRDYHPDDEFRRVNWKATARAGRPISNTFRSERNQRVLILVDAGHTMATSIGGFTRFEYAVDSAVALAELAARVGDHVGMVAFGRDTLAQVAPKTGKAQARLILDQLFDLYPTLEASNYRRAFATLLGRYSRRALLVLLTELTEPAAMESLFQAMPALVSRHLVIVGSVADPTVRDLAAARPASSQEVYLKAAAEASLLARRQAASKLRAMGAKVVDRPPDQLAGKVADEYLRIKAYGRL